LLYSSSRLTTSDDEQSGLTILIIYITYL
jgi:hypothetical protein